jgi:phosphate:Na+ symporter
MQSSTASIAVTLSAFYAGAIGLDQGCALIIGQNIGTATSSAMAAIGASTTAKRLAVAYILFKIIAALIFLALFPLTMPLISRASSAIDGVTLLAAYHTAYNVVGVAVLMPVIDWFTRFVERLLPDRTSPLTRGLDPAALATPIAAAEGVRRTVARAIGMICESVGAALTAASDKGAASVEKSAASVTEAADALGKALEFMSDVSGPPQDEDEQRRVTSTLHALDHATRLAETAGEQAGLIKTKVGPEDARAAELCAEAMRCAASIADEVVAAPGDIDENPIGARGGPPGSSEAGATLAPQATLARLQEAAKALGALRLTHRSATLSKVATGELTADEAIARVDQVARLEALARHAWRSAAYLAGHNA